MYDLQTPEITVGASLLAMAVGQSMEMLGLMVSSPASRLLQGSWVYV
jgi:hypothetical protein